MAARLLVPLLTAVLAGGTAAPASAATCADVFPASFVRQVEQEAGGLRVTASVHDTRTGCRYDLHPGLRLTTASVVKAGVLGATLLRAQDEGRTLTDAERAHVRPMIGHSHDAPHTTTLYGAVGVAGMDRLDRLVGAVSTSNTAAYGATLTTARDRTVTSLRMPHPLRSPFTPASRAEAWRYLTSVHPTQRWGISAGVPAGWQVALKNGFYPLRGNGWRVGSTGFVRRSDGAGYAVTVMTDRGTSQVQGLRLVERVAARVSGVLLGGPSAPRSVDRARCTTASGGESWGAVAARIGSATPADVQRVSGGGRSPLQGQRACAPDLRPG